MNDPWQSDIAGDASPRWKDMAKADREREYSPSSAIGGNYQPHIESYIRESEAARATLGRGFECRYGPAPAHTLDLFLPDRGKHATPCPLMVFIHGGYWQELSKAESLFSATGFIDQGVAFAALDYTLAPEATLDQIVAECRDAVAWLQRKAETYGIDRRRIVVSGSSAGAHLAAMCALADGSGTILEPGIPAALVLVSGIFDLEALIGTPVNDALNLDLADAARNSPLRHDLTGFPPAIIAWGEIETEEFKRQSRAFAQAARAGGGRAQTLEIPGRNHFDVILDLGRASTLLGERVGQLLRVL